ncbi:MAG: hypothetical protein GY699_24430 [Desulfobacteraceae bacterium]|nr:hypothetical protein [Desulfobacteraceae bacterium]
MKNTIVFFYGNYLKKEDVRITPEDRGGLFGDGIYEVMKSYKGKLFEVNAHFASLERCLKNIENNFNKIDELESIRYHLINENGCNNQYDSPQKIGYRVALFSPYEFFKDQR